MSATSRSCSAVSMAPMAARRTIRRTSCRPPKGGAWPWPRASTISVTRASSLRMRLQVGRRVRAAGQLLAQRAGGVTGQQVADLVELQQLQACVRPSSLWRSCLRGQPTASAGSETFRGLGLLGAVADLSIVKHGPSVAYGRRPRGAGRSRRCALGLVSLFPARVLLTELTECNEGAGCREGP